MKREKNAKKAQECKNKTKKMVITKKILYF